MFWIIGLAPDKPKESGMASTLNSQFSSASRSNFAMTSPSFLSSFFLTLSKIAALPSSTLGCLIMKFWYWRPLAWILLFCRPWVSLTDRFTCAHSWTSPDQDSDPTIQCRQELVFCRQLAILNRGDFFSTQGYLSMSGDIYGCHTWGSEQRSWMLINILQCTGQSPTTKNYLISNVNGAKVENPCWRPRPRSGPWEAQEWTMRTHTHAELNFTWAPYCVLLVGLISASYACSMFQFFPAKFGILPWTMPAWVWSDTLAFARLLTWIFHWSPIHMDLKVIINLSFSISAGRTSIPNPYLPYHTTRIGTVKSAWFTAPLDIVF